MLRLDLDDVEESRGEEEIVVAVLDDDDSSIDDMMKVKEGKDKPPRKIGKYVIASRNRTQSLMTTSV